MLFSSLVKNLVRLRRRASFFGSRTITLQKIHRLQQEGAARDACELCEELLLRNPKHVQARYELGKMQAQIGKFDSAFVHLHQVIEFAPGFADAYIALGNIFNIQGDGGAAVEHYQKALSLDADNVLALYNLGVLLKRRGEYTNALPYLENACRLSPELDDVLKEWILCLVQLGCFDEALKALQDVVVRQPTSAQARNYLGFVQQKMHDPQAALRSYELALEMGITDADLFNNMAIVLQELGRVDEASCFYDRALEEYTDPKLKGLPKFHKTLARLLCGDFRAWPDYEIRLESEGLARRSRKFPRWSGGDLAGRTLLVYGEQGLGDEIMFASCLPDVIARARHCVIECAPKLEDLFRNSFPEATVYASTPEKKIPLHMDTVKVDAEVPIGSLPLYFRRNLEEFPSRQNYLQAVPEHVALWKDRLSQLGHGLKVGISWRGGTYKTGSPLRSIDLGRLLPILGSENARFVSLQYTGVDAEISEFQECHGIVIEQWPEAIIDYAQTAALVSALDLVISVCTSVIHLGGALGKPVWVMTPYSPEWRYGLSGDTMPWYSSVRLFRQPAFGQWEPVINDIALALQEIVAVKILSGKGKTCHEL